jgi:nucleoside-diphosphate-sugar epimerase
MSKHVIALTGASGYIGTKLVRIFKSHKYSVVALGRNPVSIADTNIPFSLENLNEEISLAGVDTLIHCAHDFRTLDYNTLRKINLEGSIRVFEKARISNVKNIIFISSTSAFEGAMSNYGRIKYEIEQYAKNYNAIIMRPGLVFNKDDNGIVGALSKFIQKFPLVPLIGKGNQTFYPCHLDDLCSLMVYLVSYNGPKIRSPIVAASEKVIIFKEIISIIAQFHKKKVIVIPIPYPILFAILVCAEQLHLKLGLRSDSLRYMKNFDYPIDFWFTRTNKIAFRPFNIDTLNS